MKVDCIIELKSFNNADEEQEYIEEMYEREYSLNAVIVDSGEYVCGKEFYWIKLIESKS